MATAKKRGEMYRVRYDVYDENGKRHQRSVTAPTKKEAERLAALGKVTASKKGSLTVGGAVTRYIESKDNILSPSTIRGYHQIARNNLSAIRNIPVSTVTNEEIQTQLNRLAEDHSPKTVANTRGLITAALKMFRPDLDTKVVVPAKIKEEVHIPTKEELALLLSHAGKKETELAIKLAAFGGLRRGEIAALKSDCIHDTYISIKRDYVADSGNNWILKERPKTDAGYRDVPLPGEIIKDILALEKSDQYGVLGLNPSQIEQRFLKARKRAGVSFRFHSLRHYFATSLHERGVPDKAIAKIGGWENVSTLQRIYQHSTKYSEDTAAAIMRGIYDEVCP